MKHNEKAPRMAVPGLNKNDQRPSFTSPFLYSRSLSSCQAFLLKIRLDTGKWILSPSGITAVVLGGGGI